MSAFSNLYVKINSYSIYSIMYKIINVEFIEYYSNKIKPEILKKYLLNSECDYKGSIELILKPGKNLTQKGPYILPPIRWLDGFEPNAEFYIKCEVEGEEENQ